MKYSKNFEKVKQYYSLKLWDIAKVTSAVGKWITANEFEEITGLSYH